MADSLDLKLDGDVIRKLVSEAVLRTLDDNKREILIKGAIESLLKPVGERYGATSPLQDAFNQAIRDVARDLAREELAKDPRLKDKIRELFEAAWLKLTAETAAEGGTTAWIKLVDRTAEAIGKTITGERY